MNCEARFQDRVFKFVAPALAVILAGCSEWLDSSVDYTAITTLQDAKTGSYVELAEINSISSHGYAVYLFDDPGPRTKYNSNWKPVINVAGILKEPPQLGFSGGCYVLTVEYTYGGLVSPVLKVNNGETICFDLLPDRGPKGGYSP